MSKSKIIGMMALIVFAMGIVLVGDAVAGEKHRLIGVYHTIKWEQMNIPGGEEGHVVALWEGKAVTRNKDGKRFGEGLIIRGVGYMDFNIKTGIGSGHFYEECTDQDGDKFYTDSEGGKQKIGGVWWEGRLTITKGTGKYQGIRGGLTWKNWLAGPDQLYFDWDVEVELPR
jgi:hypothetical protein